MSPLIGLARITPPQNRHCVCFYTVCRTLLLSFKQHELTDGTPERRIAYLKGHVMTLTRFLDDYYFPFRPATSGRTIKLYRNTLRKFGQWLGHPATIDDLTNPTVGKYLAALNVSGLRPATVAKERSQLLAIWRDARNEGLVDRGPRIQQVKVPEPIPRALRVSELKQLWLSFDKLQGSTGGNPNSDLLRAVATIQLTTAERIGAVSQLEWSDISENVVTFRAETRKGGRKSILKQLPGKALENLELLHRDSSRIFPGCHGTTKLFTLYSRAFKRSELEVPKGKTSHLLRASHATYVQIAGGDAAKSLGHSSRATTDRHYIDASFDPDDNWKLLPWAG